MHSRRDQVQAHSFVVNRLRSALVSGEPDAPRVPLRRTPGGLLIGALLSVLLVGGVALFSFLRPGGGSAWRQPGTLIVDKGSGTRYVLSGERLHPVLNHASARLLLGGRMTVRSVSAKALAQVPRGGQVGIVGAPDALPDPARSGDQSWLVCATAVPDEEGVPRPGVTVLLDSSAADEAGAREEAALVRTPDDVLYLAAGGRRMRLTADWVSRALGLDERLATPVRSSWIGALPAGPDLGSLPVAGRGLAGPMLDGRRTAVGQVLRVRGTGILDRYFLVVRGGLVPVGRTAVALVLGDPASAAAYGGRAAELRTLSSTGLASASLVDVPPWAVDLPPLPGALVPDRAERVPCVLAVPADRTLRTAVVWVPVASATAGRPEGLALVRDGLTADRVGVPADGGLLARTAPAPGVPGVGLYLVVESGGKYPLADEKAAEALGYQPARAATVPAGFLALLPTGPTLHLIAGGDA